VRDRLNQEFIIINLISLAVAGCLSYWFAGRTLKPIEEAHEAQARFAADASHELRTPLTNIRLENEVFLRQRHFSEREAREILTSNLEEVQRLEGLSGNLLALTQYGNVQLKLHTISIAKTVSEVVELARKTAESKKATFKIDVPKAKVVGNHESLIQLLGILIDNAVKYGPPEGEVNISGGKQDNYYLLAVQDRGPGIAEEDLPYIFDRLYRGDKARSSKVGGFGLGLSLAKAIADASKLELIAQNIPEGGASFIVKIPLAGKSG
jgi:signal transduction histidine kinase